MAFNASLVSCLNKRILTRFQSRNFAHFNHSNCTWLHRKEKIRWFSTNNSANSTENDVKTKEMMNQFYELFTTAKYEEALELSKVLRKHTFYSYGGDSPVFASAVNNQALIYKSLGQFVLANNLFELALDTYSKCVGKKHASYVTALSNLATVQVSLLRLDEALLNYEEALSIRKEIQPEDHVDAIVLKYQIGSVYRQKNQLDKAFTLQTEALKQLLHKYGKEHTLSATAMNNLAITCKQIGVKLLKDGNATKSDELFKQAEEYFHCACGIRGRLLSTKHPDFVASMYSLSELYESWNKIEMCNNVRMQSLTW